MGGNVEEETECPVQCMLTCIDEVPEELAQLVPMGEAVDYPSMKCDLRHSSLFRCSRLQSGQRAGDGGGGGRRSIEPKRQERQ